MSIYKDLFEDLAIFTEDNIRYWLERGEEVCVNDCTAEIIKSLECDMDLIHFTEVSEYGEQLEMVRVNK